MNNQDRDNLSPLDLSPSSMGSKSKQGGWQPKVLIKTFGCQMNEADSELYLSYFRNLGFGPTDDKDEADAVLLNTCTVRQHAEDKAVSMIGRFRNWKRENPKRKLIVAGCAVERIGAKNLLKKFPFVDAAAGAKSISDFPRVLRETLGETRERDEKNGEETAPVPAFPFSAYLTIMRGCSMRCSYCVVPSVRGKAAHRNPGEILKEAEAKIKRGAKELILLGQTVNSYLWEDSGGKTDFTDLLGLLSQIKGLGRIRFMSPHPLFFNEKFFVEFEKNEKIASHVHLPVQSGSDRILKIMKRGYGAKDYTAIVRKLKSLREDAAVSTDFIAGFPGETKEDFEDTLALVDECGFSMAFCFKYSPRKPGEVEKAGSEKEAKKRLEILLGKVKEKSREILRSRIGKIETVLLETENFGKSSADFRVRTDGKLAPGGFVKVKIDGGDKNILSGKVME